MPDPLDELLRAATTYLGDDGPNPNGNGHRANGNHANSGNLGNLGNTKNTENAQNILVPPFPVDVLPGVVRSFVETGAESIGCPPDFIVAPVLAATEALIGSTRWLTLKPGWSVFPGGWYAIVGRSGTAKSPAMRLVSDALTPLQVEAWERYERDRERWEATPKDERGEPPRFERFFVTDSTTEALASALAVSPGVLQLEDELRRRLKALDSYRQGGDRQILLSLWSNSPLNIARKSSAPLFIQRPVSPLVGGIQPSVLGRLAGEGDDAAAEDGWLPRFLVSYPDAEPRPLTEAGIDDRATAPLVALFGTLRLATEAGTPEVTLTRPAWLAFKAWHKTNQAIGEAAEGLEHEWAAKAPTHVARFALSLHTLSGADGGCPLAAETMEGAVEIVEYYRGHLPRILPAFGKQATGRQPGKHDRVLRAVRSVGRETPDGWAPRSKVYAKLRTLSTDELTAALLALQDAGRVEGRVVTTATRTGEEWREVDSGDSQDSQRSQHSQDSRNSQDSRDSAEAPA